MTAEKRRGPGTGTPDLDQKLTTDTPTLPASNQTVAGWVQSMVSAEPPAGFHGLTARCHPLGQLTVKRSDGSWLILQAAVVDEPLDVEAVVS